MRYAMGAVIVVALVLGWLLAASLRASNEQALQIDQLKAKLADKSKRESFDLQSKCAAQAESQFYKLGYRLDGSGNPAASFESHYDPKTNICFMALSVTTVSGGYETINKFLMDAFGNRSYAEYMWQSDGKKKYWEVKPFACRLIPPNEEERSCQSEEEYTAFIGRFMD